MNTVSVIIPVRNREQQLRECLQGLKDQTLSPFEVIVVDDGSADGSAEMARSSGAIVLTMDGKYDANFCRNRGAEIARGSILLFLDSDVVPLPNVISQIEKAFAGGDLDALVGLYSAVHPHRNPASQFKNLWIRYSYLTAIKDIDWIFGAVSAVRRDVYWSSGGFDGTMSMDQGGEDLELGKRLIRKRHKITLDPLVEVMHLKRHTLTSLLQNDFQRSCGFVRIAMHVGHLKRSLTTGFVNVYPSYIYSVLAAWLVMTAILGNRVFGLSSEVAIGAIGLHFLLNLPFLRFASSTNGVIFGIRCYGILFLDHIACGGGVIRGLFTNLAFLGLTFSRRSLLMEQD